MHETPVLDKAPPPRVARGLSTILLTLFGLAFLLSIVVPLPESVQAPFVVVTEGGGDPVVAAEGGRVEVLAVSAGDRVQAGQVLATLRSTAASERAAALLQARQEVEGSETRTAWMAERQQRRLQAAEAELQGLDASVASLSGMVQTAQRRAEGLRARQAADAGLHAAGALSERELEGARLAVEAAEIELSDLRGELASARAALAAAADELVALRTEAEEERRSLSEATQGSDAQVSLLQAVGASEQGVEPLVAPCAGEVVQLAVSGPGAWVAGGQPVAHLACAGQPLVAEVQVPVARVGRVQRGQPVRLRYDAFPYLRYGLHRTEVHWIAPAGIDGQFLARVQVPAQPFEIAGGAWPVKPGMTGSAEIVLARRPAITWAFEPLAALWDRWFA